jgi:hypothetical protein
VDVVIMPAHRKLRRILLKDTGFFIPSWVSGVIDTDLDYSVDPWHGKLRDELRKLRKYDYTYTVSRGPDDVELFYRTMYRPVVVQSHGEDAPTFTLSFLLARLDDNNGELLWILRGGHRVAGAFLIYEKDRGRLCAYGVDAADRELIKAGATAACYHSALRRTRERGFKVLYIGSCRPFLDDGLLLYKKKWGFKVTGANELGHVLKIRRPSDAVATFLENNAFIHADSAQLRGAVFHRDSSSEAAQAKVARLSIDGLHDTGLYMIAPLEKSAGCRT